MPRYENMLERLPTLYRPEPDSSDLLPRLISAFAEVLENVNAEAGGVLQSHWFGHADRALFNAYFSRGRQLQDLPPPPLNDPELALFPYIADLGHLASLVSISPWQDPPLLREVVETYRTRIRRIVALYRNGLGTPGAIRRMVEAQLPVDPEASLEHRDRAFFLEEFAPLTSRSLAVPTRGEPDGIVGPLMRWDVENTGIGPAMPTVYVQGIAPQPNELDATENPVIELYGTGSSYPRLGIGYSGVVAPGDTLRLRPAYSSWVVSDAGVQTSSSLPSDNFGADPTAPGPWSPAPGAPAAPVAAILRFLDNSVVMATNAAGVGTLWRYDGDSWTALLTDLPEVRCLAQTGQYVLIGVEDGLRVVAMFPDGQPVQAVTVAALAGLSVNALHLAAAGRVWAATNDGVAELTQATLPDPGYDLAATYLQGTELLDIHEDHTGTLFFAGSLGIFQYQPAYDAWSWYAGESFSDQDSDWEPLADDTLPSSDQVFLPPCTSVFRGPDESLWIGTTQGIARYYASPVRGLTYKTLLAAFPDLTTGAVHSIRQDSRGIVWFCTDRGLFRYDGRDFWQHQAGSWVQLGTAEKVYTDAPEPQDRGAWRFDRDLSQWQTWDNGASDWTGHALSLRSADESTVTDIAWTDGATADMGQWDGTTFTSSAAVPDTDLIMRFKPDETRIVDGGIPAIPALPPGDSVWRYLSLEPEALPAPTDLPAWTIEGRLVPPPIVDAAAPGRFDVNAPPPSSDYDESVFAFNPSARVWFTWEPRQPLSVLVRLKKKIPTERIEPAILDRVWQGIQQVRPAGVRAMLAIEEEIVRGK